jgi:hypothetical protein
LLVSLVLFLQLVVVPQIHPARLIQALLLPLVGVAAQAAVVILVVEVLAAVHLAAAVLAVPVVVAFLAAVLAALLPLAMAHLLDISLDIPMSLGVLLPSFGPAPTHVCICFQSSSMGWFQSHVKPLPVQVAGHPRI